MHKVANVGKIIKIINKDSFWFEIFVFSILLPYSTSQFVSFFKPGQTEVSEADAHLHAYCLMGLILFSCFYSHNYTLWVEQFAIEIRTAFSSLLYRKALKLTPTALSQISLGNIITLITKDVYSFQTSIFTINDTWNGLVQTIIICYILYSQIGSVTFIGIGILMSAIPLQGESYQSLFNIYFSVEARRSYVSGDCIKKLQQWS